MQTKDSDKHNGTIFNEYTERSIIRAAIILLDAAFIMSGSMGFRHLFNSHMTKINTHKLKGGVITQCHMFYTQNQTVCNAILQKKH